jgi:hypothetical protein
LYVCGLYLKQNIIPTVAPAGPLHPFVPPASTTTTILPVSALCHQVEIEVETCDKGGTFLGTIVLAGPKPINLGITLARMGLAKTQQFFAADR